MKFVIQTILSIIVSCLLLLFDYYVTDIKFYCIGMASAFLVQLGIIFKECYELHTRRNIKD